MSTILGIHVFFHVDIMQCYFKKNTQLNWTDLFPQKKYNLVLDL